MRIFIFVFMLMISASTGFAEQVSEDARRFVARGEAAVEIANSDQGFQNAALEFEKAINAAPSWSVPYYNLAIVEEKLGQYGKAVKNLKKYLELAPNASDAQTVQTLIYKLEYKRDNSAAAVAPVVQPASYAPVAGVAPSSAPNLPKSYSHLSGRWCLANRSTSCYDMTVQGNQFTLEAGTVFGNSGRTHTKFKGSFNSDASISGRYHYGSSLPNICGGQMVWHRQPSKFKAGSRLYPGEEELMIRYDSYCFRVDQSTCQGVDNCAATDTSMHFVRR